MRNATCANMTCGIPPAIGHLSTGEAKEPSIHDHEHMNSRLNVDGVSFAGAPSPEPNGRLRVVCDHLVNVSKNHCRSVCRNLRVHAQVPRPLSVRLPLLSIPIRLYLDYFPYN